MKKSTYKLTNWSVVCGSDDPYMSPEQSGICLQGTKNDGNEYVTSYIIGIDGRKIETINSFYILDGPPNNDYLSYLKNIGKEFDENEPIKDMRKPR